MRYLAENDRRRLIDMYIHEGELENAFSVVMASEKLSWFRRFRDPVANVDPAAYFEAAKELLMPFTAGETGRRHYREIANHLEEIQASYPGPDFGSSSPFLKDKHSNRPAFLDELEKTGF